MKLVEKSEVMEVCEYLNSVLYIIKSNKENLLISLHYLLKYNIEDYLDIKYGYYLARYAIENSNLEIGLEIGYRFSDYVFKNKEMLKPDFIRIRKFAHYLYGKYKQIRGRI